ncbi:hypothetical protein DRO59_02200 [Candidatus Bathyarchaeota archaeon]|nr:MAG: hypothetical protein DRO59_02200 [Candidatus Bathyarchaeota archaeon]
MERRGGKVFSHFGSIEKLKQVYNVKLGWELSIKRAPRGMCVSVIVAHHYLLSTSLMLVERLWRKLEEHARIVSYRMESNICGQRWWWTVTNPVHAIQVLASFVGVTCSDAEARLTWIGL